MDELLNNQELKNLFENGKVVAVTFSIYYDNIKEKWINKYYELYDDNMKSQKKKISLTGCSRHAEIYKRITQNNYELVLINPYELDELKDSLPLSALVKYVSPRIYDFKIGKTQEEGQTLMNELSDIANRLSRNNGVERIDFLYDKRKFKARIVLSPDATEKDIQEIDYVINEYNEKIKSSPKGSVYKKIIVEKKKICQTGKDDPMIILTYNPKYKKQDDKIVKGFLGIFSKNSSFFHFFNGNGKTIKPNKLGRDIKRKIKVPRTSQKI